MGDADTRRRGPLVVGVVYVWVAPSAGSSFPCNRTTNASHKTPMYTETKISLIVNLSGSTLGSKRRMSY